MLGSNWIENWRPRVRNVRQDLFSTTVGSPPANFCDFFRPGQPVRRVAQSRDQSDASAALSALFGEAPAITDLEENRTDDGSDDLDQKLKDLFGDD